MLGAETTDAVGPATDPAEAPRAFGRRRHRPRKVSASALPAPHSRGRPRDQLCSGGCCGGESPAASRAAPILLSFPGNGQTNSAPARRLGGLRKNVNSTLERRRSHVCEMSDAGPFRFVRVARGSRIFIVTHSDAPSSPSPYSDVPSSALFTPRSRTWSRFTSRTAEAEVRVSPRFRADASRVRPCPAGCRRDLGLEPPTRRRAASPPSATLTAPPPRPSPSQATPPSTRQWRMPSRPNTPRLIAWARPPRTRPARSRLWSTATRSTPSSTATDTWTPPRSSRRSSPPSAPPIKRAGDARGGAGESSPASAARR